MPTNRLLSPNWNAVYLRMWTAWLWHRFGSNRRTSETRLGGCGGGEADGSWNVHGLPMRFLTD
jgi:hypothetical protein